MSETQSTAAGGPGAAGWGIAACLPAQIQRRMIQADAEESRAEREQAAERERLAEERHQRAMTLYAQQAEGRGEYVSALAIATGQVQGRTFGQIFATASEAADREDQIAAARANREAGLTHIEFGEPRILTPAARSSTGRKIATRARHFMDMLDARRQLAAAERAAEASKNDYGLVEGVTLRRKDDPVVLVSPARRRSDPVPADSGLRIRGGGPIVGIH